jgi:glutamyl-Q tRNA(Asp) synthetase
VTSGEVNCVASGYIGRFAPSPTGPLHAGSLVAALASWLDARAHGGQWLVRMEDVDTTRCLPGMDQVILQQLTACGLHSDLAPVYQSQRFPLYSQALERLAGSGHAYPCGCSRRDIELSLAQIGQAKPRHGELIYPGTCRKGLQGKAARAWRFKTDFFESNWPVVHTDKARVAIKSIATIEPLATLHHPVAAADADQDHSTPLRWTDRRLGTQAQDVATEVGDFILKRADGCFAYQLAVVADDGAQGITDVVRGADLADNTARQILLQRALDLPTPRYLHTPLVLGPNGEKLSKQNGAQALDTSSAQATHQALVKAAQALGLSTPDVQQTSDALLNWTAQWPHLYPRPAFHA